MQVVTLNSWITEFYQQLLKEFFETINPASSGKIPSSLIYFIPCWVRCEWILQGYYALFSKLSLSSIYMLRACNLIFLGFRRWHYLHIPFFFSTYTKVIIDLTLQFRSFACGAYSSKSIVFILFVSFFSGIHI